MTRMKSFAPLAKVRIDAVNAAIFVKNTRYLQSNIMKEAFKDGNNAITFPCDILYVSNVIIGTTISTSAFNLVQ